MGVAETWRVRRATRASLWGAGAGTALLAILVALPFWGDRADMRLVAEFAYLLALAQIWNLLAGYAGLVSVGQHAFVGLGGYLLFVGGIYLGLPALATLPFAGVVSALVAVPTAWMLFRLRGAYFAIGTWVVADVFRLAFAQVGPLGGGSGMSLPLDIVRAIAESRAMRESLIYYIALALAVAVTLAVFWLLRSRVGIALAAIRDSETASESLGVDNARVKLWTYVAAAFGTGIVGALIFLQKLRISPDAGFSLIDWTANVLFIVIIGGIGRIEGPIVGTLVFFLLREFFSGWGAWYMIMLGCLAIAVMMIAPQGIWGLVAVRFDLHFFPLRRRLEVSSAGLNH
jgi:branched-chain amino acid transport system permease protein